jgi:hypothetical protein
VIFCARVEACLPLITTLRQNCSWQSPLRAAAQNIGGSHQREDLRTPKAFGAWLEVGDEHFNSSEIQRLYEADDYPLRKSE